MKNKKKIGQVVIEVNVNTEETKVFGSGDPWMDMAYILEGLGVVCQMCVDEGRKSEEVYKEVQEYFNKLSVDGYKILK